MPASIAIAAPRATAGCVTPPRSGPCTSSKATAAASAPVSCADTYPARSCQPIRRKDQKASVMAGLRCAPDRRPMGETAIRATETPTRTPTTMTRLVSAIAVSAARTSRAVPAASALQTRQWKPAWIGCGAGSGPATSGRGERCARDDLWPGVGEHEGFLGLGARDRRVPGKRIADLDRVVGVGRGDRLARRVATAAALMVESPLVGIAGVGVEAATVGERVRERSAGPGGLLAHAREDLVGGSEPTGQLLARLLELDDPGQVRVEPA